MWLSLRKWRLNPRRRNGGHFDQLQKRTSYQELGGGYFDRRNKEKQHKRLMRQLGSLGVKVTVEEIKEAA